eukprot:1158758-Pelagomonas_calceolata.AAC.3
MTAFIAWVPSTMGNRSMSASTESIRKAGKPHDQRLTSACTNLWEHSGKSEGSSTNRGMFTSVHKMQMVFEAREEDRAGAWIDARLQQRCAVCEGLKPSKQPTLSSIAAWKATALDQTPTW